MWIFNSRPIKDYFHKLPAVAMINAYVYDGKFIIRNNG